jgi:protein SCO1/2
MRRRTFLAGLGTAASVSTAGCVGSLGGGNENTVLRKPDRGGTTSADLPYPAWGERIPDVTVPAPLQGKSMSLRDVETPFFTTFFYTTCRTVCPTLISTLRQVQTHSVQNEYAEEVGFYPIDFDPARDTVDVLESYADQMNVDTDAGNWAFLRPEDEAAAKDVVTDEFGIVYEQVESEYSEYEFVHTTIITLANADGYVERTYRLGGGGFDQIRLIEDLRTVRDGGGIL